jgi:predicted RNA-binding protein associated with RNAse of E/G family
MDRDDVVVTLSEPLDLESPLTSHGRVMLEKGSLAVWFTFPGAWHDIGRFHLADGSFTGLYANILTPPSLDGPAWWTTDLFLDVWWPAGGEPTLLDQEELDEALALRHIEPALARRATEEAERLLGLARHGVWPPPVVSEWTLERALASLGEG